LASGELGATFSHEVKRLWKRARRARDSIDVTMREATRTRYSGGDDEIVKASAR
jgi:hypothetical protein